MVYLCKTLVYRNQIHVRLFTIYALNKSNTSLIKLNTISIILNDFFYTGGTLHILCYGLILLGCIRVYSVCYSETERSSLLKSRGFFRIRESARMESYNL